MLIILFFCIPPNKGSLYPKFHSFKVLDRNGRLLREVRSQDYKTSIWQDLRDISPYIIRATIIREDKRFLLHHGVDIIAISRSFFDNIIHRRIVSGGSTITMQVAKMALNSRNRGIFNKLLEIIYALKLELYLSKAEILEIYLNRSPYGNQVYGVEAAAEFYFDKPAWQLSLAEATALAVIPKSPVKLNPYQNPGAVLKARATLINNLYNYTIIDSTDLSIVSIESLIVVPKTINFKAPHFVDFLLLNIEKTKLEKYSEITSTIDYSLQENLEKMLTTSIKSLTKFNVTQGAVVVIDNKSGEVLAMVGSKEYFDAKEGQVNGCTALRQPGSSIKPFLYALGLACGMPVSSILPDSLIEFRLPDGTLFAPRNFGDKYHGPTRAREALGSSFNVPTVYLLEKLGVERFHHFLRELDFKNLEEEANHYGLALALGAAEVTLLEMANGYRMLARGGILEGEKYLISPAIQAKTQNHVHDKQVLSREIAYIITNILSDNASRIKAFGDDSPLNLPFPCAVKTGTSKNFRDNWCLGYTTKYVVGVWVGNFDGSAMHGVSGISGAAPLFRDIMIELHKDGYPPGFDEPPDLLTLNICTKSGRVAGRNCTNAIEEIFIRGTEPKDTCTIDHTQEKSRLTGNQALLDIGQDSFHIITPKPGDIYKIDPQISYVAQAIHFKVGIGNEKIDDVIFKLNDHILATSPHSLECCWKPKPGEYVLEVEAKGDFGKKTERVRFRVF